MSIYEEICTQAKKIGEKNDCTVKALTIAAHIPYDDAHKILEDFGRKKGKGVQFRVFMEDFAERVPGKMAVKIVIRKPKGGKATPKTIGKMLPEGDYICFVNRHVFALFDGTVMDWTEDRQHPIDVVYKIIKI